MQLNALGQMVNACWQRLPSHFFHLTLDASVVMPNHIHGILVLTHPNPSEPGVAFNRRDAALVQGLTHLTDDVNSNATPNPNDMPNPNPSKPGVAFGRAMVDIPKHQLPNAAPLPPRLEAKTVGAIVLNFKLVTTRPFNRIKRSPGRLIWQRNYYEHIIRSEESLCHIRQYVYNNPLMWQQDQLHPDNPSKW